MNRQLAQSLADEVEPARAVTREFPTVILLSAIVAIALLLRLDLLVHTDFVVDADEAIVGLMAQHMVKGSEFPTFYYGQHYMGSLEPILTSFVFHLFGSSPLTLKIIPLVFALLLIPLTYLLGKRVGGKGVGLIAALYLAAPPAAFLEWSTKARGGFIEIVVIGTLALILSLSWLEKRNLGLTASIGALLGLGWWTNNQIIFTILPIGLFFTLKIFTERASYFDKVRDYFSHVAIGTLAFIVGGLPFWVYNLNHSFVSFKMFGGGAERWDNLVGFISSALPIILGGRRFWHTEDYFYGSASLAFLLFGILACVLIYHRRRAIFALVKLQRVEAPELLMVFLVATASVFVLSSFGSLYTAPRYLLPAYPVLYVLVGVSLSAIWGRSRASASICAFAVLFFNLSSYYWGGRSVPGEPVVFQGERVQRDHGALLDWLYSHDYKWVRTNYWIGYRLAFETGERVKFLIFQPPHQVRLPEYERVGEALPLSDTPYLLTPLQSPSVERGLAALGYTFEKGVVGGYHLLHKINYSYESPLKRISPTDLTIDATHKAAKALEMIDGNVDTRWGSGAPQAPGMKVTVGFTGGKPRVVRGVRVELGEFKTDYPRQLSIKCNRANEAVALLTPAQYLDILFVLEGKPVEIQFAPERCETVELIQEGSDTFFDWSVAELSLFE